MKKLKNTIASRLIIALSAVLIILSIILILSINTILNHDVKQMQEGNMKELSSSIHDVIELSFDNNQLIIESYSKGIKAGTRVNEYNLSADNREDIRSELIDDLKSLKDTNKEYDNVYIIGLDGYIIAGDSIGLTGLDLTERDYFKNVISKKLDKYINPTVIVSKSTNHPVVVMTQAIYFNNQIVGVFCVSRSMKNLSENYIINKTFGENGYPYIFDGYGQIIFHPDSSIEMNDFTDKDFISNALTQKKDHTFEYLYDGSKKFAVYSYINDLDWYISVTTYESDLIKIATEQTYVLGIALFIIFLLLDIFLINFLKRNVTKPLKTVEMIIHEASQGDLSNRGELRSKNELGRMTGSFNSMLDSINDFFKQLQSQMMSLENVGVELTTNMAETTSSVEEIRSNLSSSLNQINQQQESVHMTVSSVEQVAKNIETQNKLIQKQGECIFSSSAGVEEMIAQMTSVSTSTEEALGYMDKLQISSNEGQHNINIVTELINEIAVKSSQLVEANTIISGIASSTNLLAMNAAIEAAHAGDAGKGFAVVADEIRKLAEQSATQSTQVNKSISEINESISNVVKRSDLSSKSFETIIINIDIMDRITREIKSAMFEQVEGSSQILGSLEDMRDISSEVNSGSAEMTAGNDIILNSVTKLSDITAMVSEAMIEIEHGVDNITEAVLSISGLSETNKESILHVKLESEKYKLLDAVK